MKKIKIILNELADLSIHFLLGLAAFLFVISMFLLFYFVAMEFSLPGLMVFILIISLIGYLIKRIENT